MKEKQEQHREEEVEEDTARSNLKGSKNQKDYRSSSSSSSTTTTFSPSQEINDFPSSESTPHLSLAQKLSLRLFGYAKIGTLRSRRKEVFQNSSSEDIYVSRCKSHGLYADIPHGLPEYGRELRCPNCERLFLILLSPA